MHVSQPNELQLGFRIWLLLSLANGGKVKNNHVTVIVIGINRVGTWFTVLKYKRGYRKSLFIKTKRANQLVIE